MYAIISELDHATILAIEKLLQEVTAGCELDGLKKAGPYHLTWQGTQSYEIEETENRLRMIAKTFAPVETSINGIGIFPGEEPVFFLAVTRTPLLSALNETIWESLQPLSTGQNPYYSPEEWVPHISIFYGNPKSAPAMGCIVQNIIPNPLRIDIKIDHLSLGYFHEQENGVMFRYPLLGER